jgi:hypothetical protein
MVDLVRSLLSKAFEDRHFKKIEISCVDDSAPATHLRAKKQGSQQAHEKNLNAGRTVLCHDLPYELLTPSNRKSVNKKAEDFIRTVKV